jgi:hypothetical protein
MKIALHTGPDRSALRAAGSKPIAGVFQAPNMPRYGVGDPNPAGSFSCLP